MPGNFKKEDLRIIKTQKSLLAALETLLERKNFRQLTINDLCAESQLSRTAFYTHFQDKYDLLKFYLANLRGHLTEAGYGYRALEQKINNFTREHTKLVRNVLDDADSESLDIIYGFILNFLNIPIETDANGKPNQRYTTISNFCAGGIVKCMLWQVRHGFPTDIQMMNRDFYFILDMLLQKDKKEVHNE